jgi:hypothetical protein
MAYCSYCAAVLDVNQTVCPHCGRSNAVAPAPASVVINERPSSVRLAAILFLIALGVGLLSIANVAMRSNGAILESLAFLIPTVGIWFLWIVLVLFLWQRQGWARIVILLLLAWNVVNLLLSILRIAASGTAVWGFAIALAAAALRVYAAYLMFRPESNAWFKK